MASNTPTRYIIYDCDPGADDAWGLYMLIKGEQLLQKLAAKDSQSVALDCWHSDDGPQRPFPYKILAITCAHGNTEVENTTKNALRILDSVDRLDIPVYRGCPQSYVPNPYNVQSKDHEYFYGRNGFGDAEGLPEVNTDDLIQKEHAVNAMYSFVCKYPNLVDFILVGALTNFAACVTMYGDDFLNKIGHVYVMGGNYKGVGNASKSAEYNFMMDPHSANVTLGSVKRPLVIMPWEACVESEMGLTLDWRLNTLGAVPTKAMDLMNKVERAIFLPKNFVRWMSCDAFLVGAYLFPQFMIAKSRLFHATVELNGTHTFGQMVLNHSDRGHGDTTPNCHIIMNLQKEHYKDIISWVGGLLTDEYMEEKWLNQLKLEGGMSKLDIVSGIKTELPDYA